MVANPHKGIAQLNVVKEMRIMNLVEQPCNGCKIRMLSRPNRILGHIRTAYCWIIWDKKIPFFLEVE
jgi:hypothetical protein